MEIINIFKEYSQIYSIIQLVINMKSWWSTKQDLDFNLDVFILHM